MGDGKGPNLAAVGHLRGRAGEPAGLIAVAIPLIVVVVSRAGTTNPLSYAAKGPRCAELAWRSSDWFRGGLWWYLLEFGLGLGLEVGGFHPIFSRRVRCMFAVPY